MKARSAALALLALAAPPAGADMISSDGMAPYEVCGLCHGLDGNSAMARFPRLAGQKAPYIEKQLRDFIAGNRDNDGGQMQAIVTEIDPGDIPEIATWFEGQAHPVPEAPPDDASGAQLFGTLGCGTCHGAPEPPQGLTVPHIAAQHRAYLEKQLRAFRDGERGNDPDGVMRKVAADLTDAQIEALAAHIAAQAR